MGVGLAIVLELSNAERGRPHELDVRIVDADGADVARIQGGFQQTAGDDTEIHEITFFPFVADLRPVALPHPGWYQIDIEIDGRQEQQVRFRANPPPPAA